MLRQKKFYFPLVSVLLLLAFGIILLNVPFKYKRVRLIENPLPLPNFLELVWPYPGSTISLAEFYRPLELSRSSSICIRISKYGAEGKWNLILSPGSESISLYINGTLAKDYNSLGVELMKYGDPDWPEICWPNLALNAGKYLIELIIGEEDNLVKYAWAFQILH